ncbi:DUF4238 domain-containing protein [Alistipes timonensis]|uniref:DUF4238 domain-containing protein n=1 Tax=Alistipes timonensis TaxID=1465754 RepID=UPI001C3C5B39|nr:DUF4238 domain-containing protein [Alistipes timonensis]MCR2031443.1 DUF4238 domain-containing protein [Alistipes timonensis]
MGKTNQLQHYIPQCYLRNFSVDKKSIHVYDKKLSKSYRMAINKCCCQKDLYLINEASIENQDNKMVTPLFFESNYFAAFIEPQYSRLLKKIIQAQELYRSTKVNTPIFSFDEKISFAYLLGVQWYRLPARKEQLHRFNLECANAEAEIIKSCMAYIKDDPKFLDLKVSASSDPAIDHADVYADSEFLGELANILADKYWEFYYTDTNQIYTSDYPITIEPHVKDAPNYYEGFGMYGAEISMPISKNIVLVIWDSQYFQDKKDIDCLFSELDNKGIRRYNSMRYYYAKERLFCYQDEYALVRLIKYINNGAEIFINGDPQMKVYHG